MREEDEPERNFFYPKGSGKKKVAPKQSTIAEEMTLFREVWNWGIK